jgi:hypothetical protein
MQFSFVGLGLVHQNNKKKPTLPEGRVGEGGSYSITPLPMLTLLPHSGAESEPTIGAKAPPRHPPIGVQCKRRHTEILRQGSALPSDLIAPNIWQQTIDAGLQERPTTTADAAQIRCPNGVESKPEPKPRMNPRLGNGTEGSYAVARVSRSVIPTRDGARKSYRKVQQASVQ